ncbi:hypothetical protein PUNSTDRAFT_142309 [Punctularia strigosozonata HHB-11173 SS5]|uniref:uncharacterized protein n=1 Tax=Punctularia strigosozonata (strain HHB-11173) TaxID=741275 RepID=UPI0004416B13|nr:uncharacterized protein PUNSTDRAFT_142309 [Punctularia strigosozonata HHB-11173 SS5]EIN10238.1 hypothetical protein PUNSTDRAFT_142309 [Punctularia strigosozonata HHB-11173 SS5]
MPTSELSDALNPNVVHQRNTPHMPYASPSTSHLQPVLRQAREHVPHRSELELAISEPVPPPVAAAPTPVPPPPTTTALRPRGAQGPHGFNAVTELVRVIAGTRQLTEIEHRRRTAWEQEQDAKLTRRDAEMEGQLVEMRNEIAALKAYVGLLPFMQQQQQQPQQADASPMDEITFGTELPQTQPHSVIEPGSPPEGGRSAEGHDYFGLPAYEGGYIEEQPDTTMSSPSMLPQTQPYIAAPSPPMVPPNRIHPAEPIGVQVTQESSLTSSVSTIQTEASMSLRSEVLPQDINYQTSYAPLPSYYAPIAPGHGVPTHMGYGGQTMAYGGEPPPEFVQGSSSRPLQAIPNDRFPYPAPKDGHLGNHMSWCAPGADVATMPPASVPFPMPEQTPSPEMVLVAGSLPPTPRDSHEDSSGDESSDMSDSGGLYTRRKNHHDKGCYTIQHAMRIRMLEMMDVLSDKALPDSHNESTPLARSAPVRFVWEKTPRQSAHNAAMKRRVVDDMRSDKTRKRFRHVAEKEFTKATVDKTFDQCFTTMRQKYRAQRDAAAAGRDRQREDKKAKRSRRLGRKKNKLSTRIAARKFRAELNDPAFDAVFQVECMSSEESVDGDDDSDAGSVWSAFPDAPRIVHLRAPTWRSSRLVHFLGILDEYGDKVRDQEKEKNAKKRVAAPRTKMRGPAKENSRPPPGLQRWMISKRWLARVDLNTIDLQLDGDASGTVRDVDWSLLGPESDAENGDGGH